MTTNTFFDIPDVLTINGNKAVVRKYFEEFGRRKKKTLLQKKNEENLKDNAPKGIVTRKIRLKMRGIITNWMEALKQSPKNEKGYKIYLPTFVTLTLPAVQVHTDKQLHATALNPFITHLKKSHNVTNYVWRAERQENGNLHYHIIIDKYISHQVIRSYWNMILRRLGYIEAYRTEQKKWHSNGFHARAELANKWSIDKQLSAFQIGQQENWNNPNTTDIHSLKSIEDVSSYICKYVTKSEEFDEHEKIKKAYSEGQINEDLYNQYQQKINAQIERKKINGRIWGCSDSLRELKDVKIIVDFATCQFIEKIQADEKSKVIKDDNYLIIYNKKIKKYISENSFINQQYKQHNLSNFHYLYPQFKPKKKITFQPQADAIKSEITEHAKQFILF